MALTMKKSVTLNGQSIINGVVAEGYQAVINQENPEEMTISSWQQDKTVYKNHRSECRRDKADFEDEAYSIQDEMIEEQMDEEE